MPELNGKALGNATVRDLLRMASGAADPNPDSSVWTPDQFKEWGRGNLNLVNLVTEDRIAKAAKGVFSDFKPGEVSTYKSTDPYVLGIMVSRATGTVWSQWIQEQILNPMGAAKPGLYVQDRQQNGLADSGLRMRLEDWMRFAVWVKRSSKESGCYPKCVERLAIAEQHCVIHACGRVDGEHGFIGAPVMGCVSAANNQIAVFSMKLSGDFHIGLECRVLVSKQGLELAADGRITQRHRCRLTKKAAPVHR